MMMRAGPLSTFEGYRAGARRRLPQMAFDYIDGAAGTEKGAARSRAALDCVALMPRVLRDMRDVDFSTSVFGRKSALPFGIAPMGMCNLAHPKTDWALATLAAKYDMPYGISTMSTTPLEALWELSNGNAWFQLYYSGDGSESFKLVERARKTGFKTLVLTVDVPVIGHRPREARHQFQYPMRLNARQILDCALHPRWSFAQLFSGMPNPANFDGKSFVFDRYASRAGADLSFLKELRARWEGDLVVKGVLDPRDAEEIHALGADAIWVSSHGCRQFDAAPPSIVALQNIRSALGSDVSLFFDSTVQSGDDVMRAYESGANFVFIGRGFLFAAASSGAKGPAEFAEKIAQEVKAAMIQMGMRALTA